MLDRNIKIAVFLILFAGAYKGFSQIKINGVLKDQNNKPITYCTVFFYDSENGNLIDFVITNEDGRFNYTFSDKDIHLIKMETGCMFFLNESVNVDLTNYHGLTLVLKEKIFELEKVDVVEKTPIKIKRDTTEYNIDALRRPNDRKIIDVLSRLPGFEINKKTGAIKFKGKPIQAFLLDGDDLFNSNYTFGSKNIPVEIVDKIEAIEDYQKDKLKKGIITSNEVAVNLVLKEGKSDFNSEGKLAYGIKNHFTSLTSLYTAKKNKYLLNAESNDISINDSPLKESTYNSLNQDEESKYSHNPFRLNSVFNNEDFDRSYNNNNKHFNANFLKKINKKLSFTSVLNYYSDRINREFASSTQFNIGEDIILNTDDAFNEVKPEFFRFNVIFNYDINNNTSLKYTVNYVNRYFDNNQRRLQNNNNTFTSKLSMNQNFIRQELSFIKKFHSALLYELNFKNAIDNSDNNLIFETPIIAINDTIQTTHFSGYKTFNELINMFYFKKGDNEFSTGLKMTFDYEKNTVSTNHHNQAKPKVKSDKIEWFGTISLNFKNFSIKSTFTPFYNNRELRNNDNAREKNLFFDFENSFSYRLNKITSLNLQQARINQIITGDFLFDGPLLIDSRLKISNDPTLDLKITNKYILTFNRFDIINQSSLNISATYSNIKNNMIADQNIDENFTLLTYFKSPKNIEEFTLNMSAEYFWSTINNKLKFSINNNHINTFNQINSPNINSVKLNFWNLNFSANSSFSSFFNYRFNVGYFISNSKQKNQESQSNSIFNFDNQLIFKISEKTFLKLETEFILPEDSNFSTNQVFTDFSINHKGKSVEYYILGANIANNPNYIIRNVSEFSTVVSRNSIFSRYIVFGVTFQF